jgi:serine/tyrosine/threonine adenylyltransferase
MRSSVREFLCSEAMFHLGIPTTRALSLVATGDAVMRDMFYDGNAKHEPGAVVCRMASSFVRFGNFEIHASRGETKILKQLADFVIRSEFSELGDPAQTEHPATIYIAWFDEIARRTMDLMIDWMRVGFVHGVMNTDNMSILGLTIDYGPYGWLEDYDVNWTPNTTDASGRRYCYGNQARIGMWNLHKLANAIYPLIGETGPLEELLKKHAERFNQTQPNMLAAKLGLINFEDGDEQLLGELFSLFQQAETDMTIFFRQLANLPKSKVSEQNDFEILESAFYVDSQLSPDYRASFASWLEAYRQRLSLDDQDDASRKRAMNSLNPKYVLRNYLAQLAIDKVIDGDNSEVDKLLNILRKPYDEQPEHESYANKRPEWARNRAGCSMLSCSS